MLRRVGFHLRLPPHAAAVALGRRVPAPVAPAAPARGFAEKLHRQRLLDGGEEILTEEFGIGGGGGNKEVRRCDLAHITSKSSFVSKMKKKKKERKKRASMSGGEGGEGQHHQRPDQAIERPSGR